MHQSPEAVPAVVHPLPLAPDRPFSRCSLELQQLLFITGKRQEDGRLLFRRGLWFRFGLWFRLRFWLWLWFWLRFRLRLRLWFRLRLRLRLWFRLSPYRWFLYSRVTRYFFLNCRRWFSGSSLPEDQENNKDNKADKACDKKYGTVHCLIVLASADRRRPGNLQ